MSNAIFVGGDHALICFLPLNRTYLHIVLIEKRYSAITSNIKYDDPATARLLLLDTRVCLLSRLTGFRRRRRRFRYYFLFIYSICNVAP